MHLQFILTDYLNSDEKDYSGHYSSCVSRFALSRPTRLKRTFKLEGGKHGFPGSSAKATIAPGFHLYAPENPAGGSQPLEFYISPKGCKLDGKPVANKKYTKEYDDVFMVDQYFFSNSVTFTQKLKPTAGEVLCRG